MSSAQDRPVTAAWLLAESAWLYTAFAVVGLVLGLGHSPYGWPAVVAVLGTSFLVARVLQHIIMPTVMLYGVQMVLVVVVLYLALATQSESGIQGLDLGWVGKVVSGSGGDGRPLQAVLGGVLGALMWWRGVSVASSDYPVDSLGTSFRVGLFVLGLAALVDMGRSEDLNLVPAMFLFFASGLIGLGIGHVLDVSERAAKERTWPKVIGGVVVAVLAVGLLLSLIQRSLGSVVSGPIKTVLEALLTAIFFVIILPIGYIIALIISLLRSLFDRQPEEPEQEGAPSESVLDQIRDLEEGAENALLATIVDVVQWVLLVIIVLIVLFLLARVLRRRGRWRGVRVEGVRESVAEEVDAAHDLGQLLLNLLPRRSPKKRRRVFNLPQDEPGVVDVFRLYFGLLVLAEDRGVPRPETETPTEFLTTLETVFPRDVVRRITAAFVRACYGRRAAPQGQIDEMRTALEQLVSGGW